VIYVPIVHSEVDLGTMADEVRKRFEGAFGAQEWKRRCASVQAMWEGIRGKLLALPLVWERTRLYQDALPICGREAEIVQELAAKGSRNHQLLAELMKRGATLMGTEDAPLMIAELRRMQSLVQAAQQRVSDQAAVQMQREGEALLSKRDAFVAKRIDESLAEGENGVLFLGLAHRVDELLEGKFEVRHLIHSLPFGADPWRRLKESGSGN